MIEKERKMKGITISDRCFDTYPWMKFGYCLVNHLIPQDSLDYLRKKQEEVENYIRKNTESLIMRAKSISRFYKTQGEKNRSHIESLIKSIANGKSIKSVNFIVDSVMIAELRNALLLGVHDVDRIEGDIILDVASGGEGFTGIGDHSVITRQNEVVLRDQIGIWASYTQGPDARTVVDAATRNIIVLGFFTPETTQGNMLEAIADALELLVGVAKGEPEEIKVIRY